MLLWWPKLCQDQSYFPSNLPFGELQWIQKCTCWLTCIVNLITLQSTCKPYDNTILTFNFTKNSHTVIIEHGTKQTVQILFYFQYKGRCCCLNRADCSCDVENLAMVRRMNIVDVQLIDSASDPCHIVPVDKGELFVCPINTLLQKCMFVRSESMHRDYGILIPDAHEGDWRQFCCTKETVSVTFITSYANSSYC